jgi:hypothetical protein
MSIFFNWPTGAPQGQPSGEAGSEIASALEALMRILRAYETRQVTTFSQDLDSAKAHLAEATHKFQQLRTLRPGEKVHLPSRLRGAWGAADGFALAMGSALGQDFVRPLFEWSVPTGQLVEFAERLTKRLESTVAGLQPNLHNPAIGRRLAAEAIIFQMFGIIIAELLAEASSTSTLSR